MADITNTFCSGVSREEAGNIINKFLNNENYRVLAVKGKWGVGKTHLVQKLLNEHSGEYYYYASVFGISSIEQLKGRIVANYHQSNSNRVNKLINNTVKWLSSNAAKIEKTPKFELGSMQIVGSLMSAAGDLGLNILFNENARNSIICIDDLERKSKLPIDELLGFVEYLVQELKCKIILIYSDDNLDQVSKEILQIYREKVIDREFTLDPTVEENLDFIFKDHPDRELIKSIFKRTYANNIRVIRKTKWLIDEYIPLIENWQPSLRNQVIRNIIIISLVKIDSEFCKRFSVSIKDLITYIINDSNYYEPSEKVIQFFQKTSELGYIFLEIDKIIIKSLETSLSIYDELKLKEIGEKLNQQEKQKQIIEKISHLGQVYYSSFGNCEKEIEEEIINFLEDNYLDLNLSQFEQIEKFASLMEINVSCYEKCLLKKMLKNLEQLDPFIFGIIQYKLQKYPELEAEIELRKYEYQKKLNITKAVEKIIRTNHILISPFPGEQANIEFLNSRTVEEYTQWLEKGHSDLYLMVKQFLTFSLPASQRLEEAIRILAKKSKLNKIRAKFLYNIDIDNLTITNDETNS